MLLFNQSFILTAESHHLSSFPAWQSVSLEQLQVKSVVLEGENPNPQKKNACDSFLFQSSRVILHEFAIRNQDRGFLSTVPSHQPVMHTDWFTSFSGCFTLDKRRKAILLLLHFTHYGTDVADVSSRHPAVGTAGTGLFNPTAMG